MVSPQSASWSVSNCVMSLLLVVDTRGWTAKQPSMDLTYHTLILVMSEISCGYLLENSKGPVSRVRNDNMHESSGFPCFGLNLFDLLMNHCITLCWHGKLGGYREATKLHSANLMHNARLDWWTKEWGDARRCMRARHLVSSRHLSSPMWQARKHSMVWHALPL